MQAHQFVTALSYGDAIGDYTIEIQRILRSRGYESEIFSEIVHPRMARYVKPLHEYELYEDDDALMILHFSIGSDLGNVIPHYRGKKMMIYHNITPHRWFIDVNSLLAYQCLIGRQQLAFLHNFCPVALGDSEYNRQELEAAGYRNTGVLPIRLDFSKFDGAGDPLVREMYDDQRTNIVVIGRVIPNKKLEDCLKTFAAYQKLFNPASRLIFAGLWHGFDPYYHALRRMTVELQAQEVVFTGHISFEELLAFYRLADALITMSEHEGFCVPLLEAFYMKVPVLAWRDCAIPYTAGKGGVLVEKSKDYAEIAGMLHQIVTRPGVREQIVAAQSEQIRIGQDFPFEKTLLDALEDLQKTEPVELEKVLQTREKGLGTGD
ncbi:MAG TPA: glycosyltransferase [Acidobacteriota bacterium]|nr:glycosyltransferase [Acidobacteriota bacterium]